MGSTWDTPRSCRPQMGPMNLAIRGVVKGSLRNVALWHNCLGQFTLVEHNRKWTQDICHNSPSIHATGFQLVSWEYKYVAMLSPCVFMLQTTPMWFHRLCQGCPMCEESSGSSWGSSRCQAERHWWEMAGTCITQQNRSTILQLVIIVALSHRPWGDWLRYGL